jgi:TonB family protein
MHRFIGVVALAAMLCAPAVLAQTAAARLSGNALDQVGGLLPYVKVRLTNRRSMAHYEMPSDQAGHFEIEGISPGDYVLEAERSGFANAQDSLALAAGEHLHHEVTLNVAPFEEHVTVGGGDAAGAVNANGLESNGAATRCEASAIGGDLERPAGVRGAQPDYPQRLRDAGISGVVVIAGRVGADGSAADMRVVRAAHADLAAAALAAIGKWEWTGARLDCVPIAANLIVTVEFRLAP